MKRIAKIVLLILTLALMLCTCSCAYVKTITRDVPRIIKLTSNISNVVQNASSPEDAIDEASKMLHPESTLSADSVLSHFKENEKIASLGDISASDIKLGTFSSPKFKNYDEALGGSVYEVNVGLTLKDTDFNLCLKILSDDTAMGIYSFEVQ